jgi:hypothetical protein
MNAQALPFQSTAAKFDGERSVNNRVLLAPTATLVG